MLAGGQGPTKRKQPGSSANRKARGAYSELEEPVVPCGASLALEDEATVADELVAVVATVSETVANEVEADSAEASIKQVLEHNVAGVFVAHRAGGKLQTTRP